jgi:CO/xanthine dehydrogenase Mo-binding subunit
MAGARRIEGAAKVTGRTRYTQDLRPGGLLHGKLVLSQHAAARIVGVDASAAVAVPGVHAVLTAADLRPVDASGPDRPLARDRVFYVGQPVAAVVADTARAAADGAAQVLVEYEPLPAVIGLDAALRPDAPRVLPEDEGQSDDASLHGGSTAAEHEEEDLPVNVTSVARFRRGDADGALRQSDVVVEGTWQMPAAHQAFIETHVALAEPDGAGGVIVSTSTQGLQNARNDLIKVLKLPAGRVRVIPMPVGGGFGGKFYLALEPLAALLALRTNRPVLLEYTRNEEFMAGRAAPSCRMEVSLGARRDGTMTGLKARVRFDNGAAAGWHGGISGMLMGSIYRFTGVDYAAYEVATNRTPADAFRAPGGTQAFFALESAVDMLAEKLDLDPLELRLRNAVREGDPIVDGTTWPRVGFVDALEAARRHPLYAQPTEDGEVVGVAAGCWYGAHGAAAVGCRVEADGSFTFQIGSIDISGSSTGLALVAAEALGVSLDRINLEVGDSGSAPQAPGSGGSAVTVSMAPAVRLAAEEARRQIFENAADELEAAAEDLEIADGDVRVKGVPDRGVALLQVASGAGGRPPVHAIGRANAQEQSPGFTVHVARVKVDGETGDWRVTAYAAFQDVGHAVNPPEIEGQVHGGATQGLGRALGEALEHDADGQPRVGSFLDYQLPTIDQIPSFDVHLIEVPSENPIGARGVGEPPNTPGPAVIANAIARATGVRPFEIPIRAEWLAEVSRAQG